MINKSLKTISWLVDEPTYRADSAYSYSTISRFQREGFRKLNSLFDSISTPSLLFGSLVDTMLTGTVDEFNQTYVIAVFPNISDTLMSITQTLYKKYGEKHLHIEDITDEDISQAALAHDYYVKPSYKNARIKKVRENCGSYYDLLRVAKGKTVIPQSLFDTALATVEALRNSKITKWYFKKDNPFENIERLYQLKFKSEYMGLGVRCMFDLIIVDHDKKLIYPIDLKTTGKNEEEFGHSFVTWRYFYQNNLYYYILRKNVENDPYFKDFTIVEYRDIVVNKFNKTPMVWVTPLSLVEKETEFYIKNDVGIVIDKIPNWRTVIGDLNYYLTNRPEYPIGYDEEIIIQNII